MATEHHGTLQQPPLLGSGIQLVAIGFVDGWLFHTRLFCLTGAKAAIVMTFMAQCPGYAGARGHPAFIPYLQAAGLRRYSAKHVAYTRQCRA
jgi:hypothetical protein